MRSLGMLFKKKQALKSSPEGDKSKLLYLESIRGIAALIVVFAHILTLYFPYPEVSDVAQSSGSSLINALFYGLPFGFLIAGHFAVVVFFVLSGYVLTFRYFQTKKAEELQRQAAKRYLRLAIPVFFTVLLSYFMMSSGMMAYRDDTAAITGAVDAANLFSFTPDFGSALYNATVGVFANGNVQYNPVLWTMPIELIGSFVIFGLALLVGKLKYRWLFYLGAIVVLSQTYYVGFVLGLILADAYHSTKLIKWLKGALNGFYTTGLFIFVLVLASIPMPWTFTGGLAETFSLSFVDDMSSVKATHYIGAFILLLLAISVPALQRILSFKPLVWLGSLSFAVYLLHFLILYSLGTWLFVQLWSATGNIYISASVSGTSVIIVTLVASIFWKKYVDDMSVIASRSIANVLLKS